MKFKDFFFYNSGTQYCFIVRKTSRRNLIGVRKRGQRGLLARSISSLILAVTAVATFCSTVTIDHLIGFNYTNPTQLIFKLILDFLIIWLQVWLLIPEHAQPTELK